MIGAARLLVYNPSMATNAAPTRTLSPDRELKLIVRRIVEAYAPDKIVLYGSHAYGTPGPDSDFDLLIIKETTEPPRERYHKVRDALWSLPKTISVEPVVVTEAELIRRLEIGDQFFENIVRRGRTLYDRDPASRSLLERLEAIKPMAPSDSPYPAERYELAARDLKAAKALLADDELLVAAGIWLQQAVEKYLKGYLLSKGWKLDRTHDLNKLLTEALKYDGGLSGFTTLCQQITKFYLENRYSLSKEIPITRAEMEKLFAGADELVARIHSRAAPPSAKDEA